MTAYEMNSLGPQQRKVLEIVWEQEQKGVTVQEVLDRINGESEGPPLVYTTILATMQKLEKLGWLYHKKNKERQRAYIYHATKSRSQAICSSLRAFIDTFLGGDTALLFQHFVEDSGLSDQECDEIRELMKNRRKQS